MHRLPIVDAAAVSCGLDAGPLPAVADNRLSSEASS